MKKSVGAILIVAATLTGCYSTLPVRGQVQGANEQFSGTAKGSLTGNGELTVVTTKGTRCTGAFTYITTTIGAGVFSCDDGRSGPFRFVASTSRSSGVGVGDLEGHKLTFTFGSDQS
jgi:hypothetical protein